MTMKAMSLNELRQYWAGGGESALYIGIATQWGKWSDVCANLKPGFDWSDFFDGCFMPEANEQRLVIFINRATYFHLVHEQWVVDVLEEAIYNVTGIPFYVELQLPEGAA
jgi:hypothetical protein